MKAIIFRAQNKWTTAVRAMLCACGYHVEFTKQPSELRGAKLVGIWNGELDGDKAAAKYCRQHGIPHFFIECGFFSQRSHVIVSRRGSVGGNLLKHEPLPPNSADDEAALDEFFRRYAHRYAHGPRLSSHVLGMLQLEKDTAIKHHSPFPTMQVFVDYVERCFPDDKVRFKAHPAYPKIELRTREPLIRSRELWGPMLAEDEEVEKVDSSIIQGMTTAKTNIKTCPSCSADGMSDYRASGEKRWSLLCRRCGFLGRIHEELASR